MELLREIHVNKLSRLSLRITFWIIFSFSVLSQSHSAPLCGPAFEALNDRHRADAAWLADFRHRFESQWGLQRELNHPMASFIDSVLPAANDPQMLESGFVMFQKSIQAQIDASLNARGLDPAKHGYKVVRMFRDPKTKVLHPVLPGDLPPQGAVEDTLLTSKEFFQMKADGYFIMGKPEYLIGIPTPIHDAGHLRPMIADPDLMAADRELAVAMVRVSAGGVPQKVDDLMYSITEDLSTIRRDAGPIIDRIQKLAKLPKSMTNAAGGFVKRAEIAREVEKLSDAQLATLAREIRDSYFKVVEPVGGIVNDSISTTFVGQTMRKRNDSLARIALVARGASGKGGVDALYFMFAGSTRKNMDQALRSKNPNATADKTAFRESLSDFLTTIINGRNVGAAELLRDLARQDLAPQPDSLFHRYFCDSGAFANVRNYFR